MKAKVREAFARMQESLRVVDEEGGYVELDEDDAHLILKWAEEQGLESDLVRGDRVELTSRSFLHYWSGKTLGKGAKGTVYQVFENDEHGEVRVVWDDDPLDEKEPAYVEVKKLRRFYE